jgi:hypothetical protein
MENNMEKEHLSLSMVNNVKENGLAVKGQDG